MRMTIVDDRLVVELDPHEVSLYWGLDVPFSNVARIDVARWLIGQIGTRAVPQLLEGFDRRAGDPGDGWERRDIVRRAAQDPADLTLARIIDADLTARWDDEWRSWPPDVLAAARDLLATWWRPVWADLAAEIDGRRCPATTAAGSRCRNGRRSAGGLCGIHERS